MATVGTTGLFLIVAAVIASAISLGGLGQAGGDLAVTAAVIALLSFAASMVCFRAESRRLVQHETLSGAQRSVVSSGRA